MSGSLFLATFAVIATWAVLLILLSGIGLALQFLFGLRKIGTSELLLSPWNGLAVLILILQIAHFFVPIRWQLLLVSAILSSGGLWAARNELRRFISSARVGWKLWMVFGFISLWIANRAIGPGNAFDSGLYHYQVVRWNHEHPIEAGLANLHPMFALNNSSHLFVALLQCGAFEGRANHLANGLLLLIWLGTVAISAARLCRANRNQPAQDLFNLVLLIPLVMYAVSKEASNPTTDLPQAAFAFAAASTLLHLLTARHDNDPPAYAFSTVAVILLASAALCIKLSAGVLAVSLALIAMGNYLAHAPPGTWRRAAVLWSGGLSFALVSTWVARGVILSGCPFYPSRFLAAPVEWRAATLVAGGLGAEFRSGSERVRVGMVQRAVASDEFRRLPEWMARPIRAATENSTGVIAWLLAMVLASTIEVAMPAVLALLTILVLIVRGFRRSSQSAGPPVGWLACVPPLIAITFWAVAAPEPRYAASSFWILAAVLLAMMMGSMRHPARLTGVALAMCALPVAYRMLALKFNPAGEPPRTVLFIRAGPDHGFHPIPVVQMRLFKTDSGLTLLTPQEPGPCWDVVLPATSSPHPLLRLRMPDDLESGFVLDVDSGP